MHKQGTLHHKVRYAAAGKLPISSPMTQIKTGDVDVEQLRKMASDTLAQATNDGRSAKAPSSSNNGDMDVGQLRKMASETLEQASSDGRLAKALYSSNCGYMGVEQLRRWQARRSHRRAMMDV